MTRAVFKKHLIHTCTVSRATTAASASGELIKTWADVEEGVRCRLVRKRERYAREDLSAERDRTDILIAEAAADIEEGDRVYSFAYHSTGTSYDAGTYDVLHRFVRHGPDEHHVTLELEQVVA